MSGQKRDFKKELAQLYILKTSDITVVDVPVLNYVMIDGDGNPNTAETYAQAIEALFSVSFAIKRLMRREAGFDYTVMPLEGLWGAEGNPRIQADKNLWHWTVMIMQPEQAAIVFDQAVEDVARHKKLAALELIRLESLSEGMSAQMLYRGPYDDEGSTIERLHEYIKNIGGSFCGRHHEIYLNSPRQVEPAKLKTILRQPFKKIL